MAPRKNVRDHVSAAILDATADAVSAYGDAASMSDIAHAAGISRATLYRYFPTRGDLLRALATTAIDDVHSLLLAANLDDVAVPEALARATRAIIGSGVRFAVIAQHRQFVDPEEVDRQIGVPIRTIFERGVHDRTLRDDLDVEVLFRMWGGLVEGALSSMEKFDHSVERASATLCEVFLHGAGGIDDPT